MLATPPENIRCGTIICAQVRHPTGRGRDLARFYLVISPTAENLPGESVICLGISRRCPHPPPPNAELLPFNPDPKSRPATGLRQRCAVFVDWSIEIQPSDIINNRVGHVSQDLLERIMEKFERFQGK